MLPGFRIPTSSQPRATRQRSAAPFKSASRATIVIFATESFEFHGRSIANHNHLLGRVEGVDGIKTGYTRDSGFNLMTSMWRGKRHVVAVVMGGHTAGRRDAQMRELLRDKIMQASVHRTAPMLVARACPVPVPSARPQTRYQIAAAELYR